MRNKNERGFLLIEVLVAGLILTASIASAMYLFRTGFEYLERVNNANLLSAKLLQAGSFMKIIDVDRQSGSEDMGDGVTMKWASRLLCRWKHPQYDINLDDEWVAKNGYLHDLFLYKVDFSLEYQGQVREYHIHVFRSRPAS